MARAAAGGEVLGFLVTLRLERLGAQPARRDRFADGDAVWISRGDQQEIAGRDVGEEAVQIAEDNKSHQSNDNSSCIFGFGNAGSCARLGPVFQEGALKLFVSFRRTRLTRRSDS